MAPPVVLCWRRVPRPRVAGGDRRPKQAGSLAPHLLAASGTPVSRSPWRALARAAQLCAYGLRFRLKDRVQSSSSLAPARAAFLLGVRPEHCFVGNMEGEMAEFDATGLCVGRREIMQRPLHAMLLQCDGSGLFAVCGETDIVQVTF